MADKPTRICGYFSSGSAPPGCRHLHTENSQYQIDLERQLAEARAENEKYKSLFDFIEDAAFSINLNANDTFAWACADQQSVAIDDLGNLHDVYKRHGWGGVIAFMAAIRGMSPIQPHITDEYKAARVELELNPPKDSFFNFYEAGHIKPLAAKDAEIERLRNELEWLISTVKESADDIMQDADKSKKALEKTDE